MESIDLDSMGYDTGIIRAEGKEIEVYSLSHPSVKRTLMNFAMAMEELKKQGVEQFTKVSFGGVELDEQEDSEDYRNLYAALSSRLIKTWPFESDKSEVMLSDQFLCNLVFQVAKKLQDDFNSKKNS